MEEKLRLKDVENGGDTAEKQLEVRFQRIDRWKWRPQTQKLLNISHA